MGIPLFRHAAPSGLVCRWCGRSMMKLLGLPGAWYACMKCDAP
jgi:hypothetical protein